MYCMMLFIPGNNQNSRKDFKLLNRQLAQPLGSTYPKANIVTILAHSATVQIFTFMLGLGLHRSAGGITTDILVRIQAVSQPAVLGSPIGQRTIGPASFGFGPG